MAQIKKTKMFHVQGTNKEYIEGKEIIAVSRDEALDIYREMWQQGKLRVNRNDFDVVFVSAGAPEK